MRNGDALPEKTIRASQNEMKIDSNVSLQTEYI